MRIRVHVVPRSSKNEIIPLGDDSFRVRLRAAPVDGAANENLVIALADYVRVAKSRITIVRGSKSKNKTVEIS